MRKLSMRAMFRKRWFWLATILTLAVCGYAVWRLTRPVYTLRISRETTYLTGPLRANGTVDYVAAMGEK